MNASLLAQSAYARPNLPTRTPRDVEYEIFARVTRALKRAEGDGTADHPQLVRALYDNRRLWSALAADLASPGNGLPAELRARMLSLAEFTRRHSRLVMRGAASVSVLIEINTAMMRGLRGEGESA